MAEEQLVEELQETELTWDQYVREEVNTLLNAYLPSAVSGNVGIKYKRPVLEELESGPVYDEEKASAVQVVLVFDFAEPIDLPKD